MTIFAREPWVQHPHKRPFFLQNIYLFTLLNNFFLPVNLLFFLMIKSLEWRNCPNPKPQNIPQLHKWLMHRSTYHKNAKGVKYQRCDEAFIYIYFAILIGRCKIWSICWHSSNAEDNFHPITKDLNRLKLGHDIFRIIKSNHHLSNCLPIPDCSKGKVGLPKQSNHISMSHTSTKQNTKTMHTKQTKSQPEGANANIKSPKAYLNYNMKE